MMDNAIGEILAASNSPDWAVRDDAALRMTELLPNATVECRLFEMLRDADTAVQVSAAEAFAVGGGTAGLLAVLQELGERADDPDADHIVYKLQEQQGLRNVPILQRARVLAAGEVSAATASGIDQIEEMFGHYP